MLSAARHVCLLKFGPASPLFACAPRLLVATRPRHPSLSCAAGPDAQGSSCVRLGAASPGRHGPVRLLQQGRGRWVQPIWVARRSNERLRSWGAGFGGGSLQGGAALGSPPLASSAHGIPSAALLSCPVQAGCWTAPWSCSTTACSSTPSPLWPGATGTERWAASTPKTCEHALLLHGAGRGTGAGGLPCSRAAACPLLHGLMMRSRRTRALP